MKYLNEEQADAAGFIVVLTFLAAIVLMLFLPVNAHAFTDSDRDHMLAHYGAGTMVAEGTHLIVSRLPWWQQAVAQTSAALIAGWAYAVVVETPQPQAAERIISGTLGGAAFSLSLLW